MAGAAGVAGVWACGTAAERWRSARATRRLDPAKTEKSRGYFISDYFFTKKQREFYTTSTHLMTFFRSQVSFTRACKPRLASAVGDASHGAGAQGVDTDLMWRRLQDVVVKSLLTGEVRMRHQVCSSLQHPQRLTARPARTHARRRTSTTRSALWCMKCSATTSCSTPISSPGSAKSTRRPISVWRSTRCVFPTCVCVCVFAFGAASGFRMVVLVAERRRRRTIL